MISKELKDQILFEEGLRLKVYHCTEGKRTIGIGHNLDANPKFRIPVDGYNIGDKIPDVITRGQAMALLGSDLVYIIDDLQKRWSHVKNLSLPRQDACYNMAFQLGCSRLMGFKKMLKALEQGDWQEAHDQALDSNWHKQTPARAKRVAGQFTTNQYYKVPTK